MLRVVGNGVIFILFAAALSLMIGYPLFGLTRNAAMPYAIALFAAGIGCAFIVQRVTTGRWTRRLSEQERAALRQRAAKSQSWASAVPLVVLFVFGLPLVYTLKDLGWSKDAVLIASMLAVVPLMAVSYLLQRWLGRVS